VVGSLFVNASERQQWCRVVTWNILLGANKKVLPPFGRSGFRIWRKQQQSGKTETEGAETGMKKYRCDICGYVYDPAAGDETAGIAAGTAFEDLPDDWECPVCGAGKDDFSAVE